MDTLLIGPGTDPDQLYATGLGVHGTLITLVRGKKVIVAAGGFEFPQVAAKHTAVRFESLGKDVASVITAFCKKYHVVNPQIPASTQVKYAKHVPGAKLVANVFSQRAIKKKTEIAAIKAVQRATDAAILAVRDELARAVIRDGKARLGGKPLTSEYLKRVAAVKLAEYNCSCSEMIISSGSQSKLPHHRGSGVIREGAVVVDIFPQSHETHYHADCTRTFCVGKPPKSFDERYNAVLAVQQRAIKQVRAGAENVDRSAREHFTELGFMTSFEKGTGYIHSLGHGVGLELHEEPRLSQKLAKNMVITVEPGLYYDYGIRIEDMGLVTKTGFQNFTKLSKEPHI